MVTAVELSELSTTTKRPAASMVAPIGISVVSKRLHMGFPLGSNPTRNVPPVPVPHDPSPEK